MRGQQGTTVLYPSISTDLGQIFSHRGPPASSICFTTFCPVSVWSGLKYQKTSDQQSNLHSELLPIIWPVYSRKASKAVTSDWRLTVATFLWIWVFAFYGSRWLTGQTDKSLGNNLIKSRIGFEFYHLGRVREKRGGNSRDNSESLSK